ncbi:MAG: amidohydrolase family protein [Pyrinomonadaceae bacterium]
MQRYSAAFVSLFLLLAFVEQSAVGQEARPDMIAIIGATLVDGSGRALRRGAVVLVRGDEIIAVGRRSSTKVPKGARVIDARGLVLAPGFIDTHNHSGGGLAREPGAASQVSQGITTVLLGQDGGSEYPIANYLAQRQKQPRSLSMCLPS